MSIEFDVYAAAAPNGTKLTTLTDLEVKEFRVSLVDTGEGRLVINRASPQATAANFAQDNVVKVRVTEVSANPIFAFFLQEGNFVAVSTGEEADETLEFGGPGLLQYLDRAIMPNYSTVDQNPGQAGNEGYWPLFAQGPAGGGSAALGSMFMRCINEAFGRSPTPYPNLTVDFSHTNDSNGTAWTSYDGTFRVPIGDSVLTVLRKFQTLGLEAQVTPNLLLRLFEQYGTNRTATVVLEKGVNILTGVERAIHATPEKSHMMVGGDNYTYVYVSTAAAIVREGFFGYGTTDSTAALTKAGQIELARRSDDTDKIDVGLLPITADGGYIPGPAGTSGNFWVGDSVKLHTGTTPLDYNMVTRRVSGIRFSEREAGDFDVVVELNGTGTEGSSSAGVSTTPAVLPPVLPGDQVDCPCPPDAPTNPGGTTIYEYWRWGEQSNPDAAQTEAVVHFDGTPSNAFGGTAQCAIPNNGFGAVATYACYIFAQTGDYANVAAVAGTTYRFSIRHVRYSPTYRIFVTWRNSVGGFLGTAIIYPLSTPGDGWITSTLDAVAPAGAVKMVIEKDNGSGLGVAIFIDEVTISTVTAAGSTAPTLGGPGDASFGTAGTYLPADAVIVHNDLSGKGGTMHDASQVKYTPTGTIAATTVQAAIAEVASEASIVALDNLTDVTITAAVTGDTLRYNGTAWVDTPGRWEPVTNGVDTFVWDGAEIVTAWKDT